MTKIVLYAIFFPFIIWAMEGLNINSLFKQSKIFQAKIMYLIMSMSLSYLVVNFIYDFCNNFKVL